MHHPQWSRVQVPGHGAWSPGGAGAAVLTVAGGSGPRAVVADEALAAVADVEEVAGLSQAPGAHLAAAAAVQDQGGPAGAAGRHPGAVAWPAAQLGAHLQGQNHSWLPG